MRRGAPESLREDVQRTSRCGKEREAESIRRPRDDVLGTRVEAKGGAGRGGSERLGDDI